MQSTEEGNLLLSRLPLQARRAHRVPNTQHSLLLVSQLCDAGCKVEFHKTHAAIIQNNQIAYVAQRDPITGLWILQIDDNDETLSVDSPPQQALHTRTSTSNGIVDVGDLANATIGSPTAAQLVAFGHATMGSPTLSTLDKALERNFVRNIPGLSQKSLRKYPPKSIAMDKGHLDQRPANNKRHSVARFVDIPDDEPTDIHNDMYPEHAERAHMCFVAVLEPTIPFLRILLAVFHVHLPPAKNTFFCCTIMTVMLYWCVLFLIDEQLHSKKHIKNYYGD